MPPSAPPFDIAHAGPALLALLRQLEARLERLLELGEEHAIDLDHHPFAPGEREQLIALLGEGEVRARVVAVGESEIHETGIPAVWLVTHRHPEDGGRAQLLEVCWVPAILRSQRREVVDGRERLRRQLERGPPGQA